MSVWFERFGFAEIGDGLFVGAYPQDGDDVEALVAAGVTRVVNLVQDAEYQLAGGREACAAALGRAGIEEARIEVVDYGNLLPGQIELAARAALDWLDAGEHVYVHCRAGMQRSAVVATAVVALREGLEPGAALARVRARHPIADPLPHQRRDLERWWARRPA